MQRKFLINFCPCTSIIKKEITREKSVDEGKKKCSYLSFFKLKNEFWERLSCVQKKPREDSFYGNKNDIVKLLKFQKFENNVIIFLLIEFN